MDLAPGEYQLSARKLVHDCEVLLDTNFTIQALTNEFTITLDSLAPPLCLNEPNGYLAVKVEGLQNFTVLWDDGDSSLVRDNLHSGRYGVSVTDPVTGCLQEAAFVLEATETTFPMLKDTYEICVGESLILALDETYKYTWHGPNGFYSIESEVELSAEGGYVIEMEDAIGCSHLDSIYIVHSSTYFDANFLIPATAKVDSQFVVVENSWPIPDSILWIIPSDSLIIEQNLANQLHLKGLYTGQFKVILQAYFKDCYVEIVKSVNIVEELEDQLDSNSIFSEILAFDLVPNPNSGIFEVNLQLASSQAVQMRLYDLSGNVIDVRRLNGDSLYRTSYNFPNLIPGYYTLSVQTNTEWQTRTLIIQ